MKARRARCKLWGVCDPSQGCDCHGLLLTCAPCRVHCRTTCPPIDPPGVHFLSPQIYMPQPGIALGSTTLHAQGVPYHHTTRELLPLPVISACHSHCAIYKEGTHCGSLTITSPSLSDDCTTRSTHRSYTSTTASSASTRCMVNTPAAYTQQPPRLPHSLRSANHGVGRPAALTIPSGERVSLNCPAEHPEGRVLRRQSHSHTPVRSAAHQLPKFQGKGLRCQKPRQCPH